MLWIKSILKIIEERKLLIFGITSILWQFKKKFDIWGKKIIDVWNSLIYDKIWTHNQRIKDCARGTVTTAQNLDKIKLNLIYIVI